MLRRYLLTYRDSCITSPLTQVDMTDSIGQRVNPLCLFYQGDNAQSGTINNSAQKALSAHFRFNDDPRTIRSQRGKLDGSTDDDAIIIFPNKNSYYKDGYHKVKSSYNEFYHLVQQHTFNGGWADFYSQIFYEYCLYGLSNSYNTPGTIENDARAFESLLNR